MTTKKLRYVSINTPDGETFYYPQNELQESEIPSERMAVVKNVVAAIESYRSEITQLLAANNDLSDSLPNYLTNPGLIVATCTDEGVIVRYDKQPIDQVVGAWSETSLIKLVSFLSENYVHCIEPGTQLDPESPKLKIILSTLDSVGQSKTVVEFHTALTLELPLRTKPTMMNRPNRVLRVTDIMYMELHGVEVDTDSREEDWDKGQHFIAKTPIFLPLNWNNFEIYMPFVKEEWDIALAPQWASQEISLVLTLQNLEAAKYNSIDPLYEARKHFIRLLSDFDDILNNAETEEQVQVFLTSHPELIDHAYRKVWPKLPLGKYVTDYVFEDASGRYLLVELEHPSKRLFIKNGSQSAALTQSIGQTLDWIRFIQDNLDYCRRELGLTKIDSGPERMVVIGRSRDLTEEHHRILETINRESPNLKIVTYDHLRDQAAQAFENIVGPLGLADQPGDTEIYYPATKSVVSPTN